MNRFTSCALVTLFALAACTEVLPENETEMLAPDAGQLDDSDAAPEPEPMPEPMPEPEPEPEPMPEPFVCGDTCEVQSQGVCYLNECMSQYDLGFPNAFNRNVGGPLPSFIWGFSIVVDSPSYVTSLGFVGLPGAPDGASADGHIALYSDKSGVPADLIVAMDEVTNMPAGVATKFEQELDTPQMIMPGTYWLMGKAESAISPFASNIVVNGSGFPSFPMAFVSADGSAPFPQTLGPANLSNNHAPNFFLHLMAPE